MKAVCRNISGNCEYELYETEFEVRNLDVGNCPNCGSKEIAPAWIKKHRLPGEENLMKIRVRLHEQLKKLR